MLVRLLAVLLCLPLAASGPPLGAHRPDVDVQAHLDFAADPAFDSAVSLEYGGRFIGSGVLVAPGWVLTAAHHSVPLGTSERLPSLAVVVGGEPVVVEAIVAHPNFGPDRPEGTPLVDLALVRLAVPVDGATPARLHDVDRDGSEVGRVGAVVGFGSVAEATALVRDTGGDAGRRIGGLNRIDTMESTDYGPEYARPSGPTGDRYLYADFDWPAGDAPDDRPLDLEYVPLIGDSGSGLYVETGGTWRLAAITQGVVGPHQNDGLRDRPVHETLAAFVRLAPHRTWISRTVASD